MSKHTKNKIKTDRSLQIAAYLVTVVFAIIVLFPIAYMASSSLKDSLQIYKVPPSIFPESPRSISLVLDYTNAGVQDPSALKDMILQDATVSLFSIGYEFNEETIGEIKIYGVKDHKTIFYTQANEMKLNLELNYGTFRGAAVKAAVLVNGDRYKAFMNVIGFSYNTQGIKMNFTPSSTVEKKQSIIHQFLQGKYAVKGKLIQMSDLPKPYLVLENFKYYYELPQMLYSADKHVAQYSFFMFIFNTVIVIGWAIFIQVALGSITAYPISRVFNKRTANLITLFFLGTLMVPFVVVMIPQFLMFKSMGMYNNYAALLVPYLAPYGFYVYLFKGFFDRLPKDLFEAAKMDGASHLHLFLKVCLPLSTPIIALIALSTFLSNLQDFFWPYMVTEKPDLWTLNVALYSMSGLPSLKDNYKIGMAFISIVPPILLSVIFSNQIKNTIATSGLK